MAKTLVFCIIGGLLLSLPSVPVMASLFLKRNIFLRPTLADRFFASVGRLYNKVFR